MSKKGLYLLWEQGVEGSNPFAPTRDKPLKTIGFFFYIRQCADIFLNKICGLMDICKALFETHPH